MNWRTAVSLLSILLFPVVLGISVVVWLAPPIEVLDEVRLVPNDRRQVVALDRPHNPDPSFHPGAPPPPSVKRTRTFQVRTNSIGLRGPELANPKRLPRLLCVGEGRSFFPRSRSRHRYRW